MLDYMCSVGVQLFTLRHEDSGTNGAFWLGQCRDLAQKAQALRWAAKQF